MTMETIKNEEVHQEGSAKKYIFVLLDDSIVEMAVFVHKEQIHFCVSTQVGCPVGCLHCATTYAPVQYRRNMNTKEICEMIEFAFRQERSGRQKVLSFSGHGEPLLNWKTVSEVMAALGDKFDRIYVTTIGRRSIFKQILEKGLTDVVFYLSLHGSTNEERSVLIPGREGVSTVEELFAFARTYSLRGGKIVLNYMLHSQNCGPDSMKRLLEMLKGCNQNVSIRFTDVNPIEEKTAVIPLSKEEKENAVSCFLTGRTQEEKWEYRYSTLEGNPIKIACGQLRASRIRETDK